MLIRAAMATGKLLDGPDDKPFSLGPTKIMRVQ